MPPQPGMFALPYASTHKARADVIQPDNTPMTISYQHFQAQPQPPQVQPTSNPHIHHVHHYTPISGPSNPRTHDDTKKEKKRKDISGKVGKEIDRRDDGPHFAENISALHSATIQLASRPETYPLYNLRLYPLSLERSALLTQLDLEAKHSLHTTQTAYEEERERVEEEWRKGRDRVRERLLEGIEERKRRAREEKEGEGAVNDPSLDIQSRIHITRKLRNKVGTSPPPTPLGLAALGISNGSTTPITTGPVTNPHSLSVDEIPSPFPFPLTSVTLTNGHSTAGGGAGGNGNRRRAKMGSGQSAVGSGALGKSLAMLGQCKDIEIEADLFEIRRGTKRRRAAAISSSKVA
ncbi:hypothetical protein BKA82DRAFT_1001324 [Pisolithus tinctorius]|uniref:Uncharacterized protein n=1 Tax=Pisolithus tinctorius Marx 270 TaxID=870435 RepID=A0A0C3P7J6_PISTI|nr:hypothetical protein BKA82DRAFT_1001324 [Pisolithus tinctorius]KIO03409.1 hypothetical protein M404DRAFT_1001324 [Pisolithus tinctorius Marx 270]